MNHYTYIAGWSEKDLWYYGVRSCKTSPEEDLWKKYFTSSKYVASTRLKMGEPDVVLVRKTFDTRRSAQRHEHVVLRRLKAVRSVRWLNRANGGTEFFCQGHTEKSKAKMREKTMSPESRLKISKAMKGRRATDSTKELMRKPKSVEHREAMSRAQKGVKKSAQHRDKLSKANLGKSLDVVTREKISVVISEMKWVNDGDVTKRIHADALAAHLESGWTQGRLKHKRRTKQEMLNIPPP